MTFLLKKKVNFLFSIILVCLYIHLMACGTILYPERKGQNAGRLDPSIVILNAVGLLFFIIPGVIAFAVDFNNGCIYLPGGRSSHETINDIKIVRFNPHGTSPSDLTRLIEQCIDKKIAFTDERMLVYSVDESKDPRILVLNANR